MYALITTRKDKLFLFEQKHDFDKKGQLWYESLAITTVVYFSMVLKAAAYCN